VLLSAPTKGNKKFQKYGDRKKKLILNTHKSKVFEKERKRIKMGE